MSISVNGKSQVPPGFRFHPTEEELLQYYLRKKVAFEKIDLDVIQYVDLNKLEPWDIQEKCNIGSTSTPQNDWYFFSHKDKKYPTGTRTNRATVAGFWKATGRDKVIYGDSKRIGMRKTLVFYTGRAPHGQKSDWIMHEYRLDDNNNNNNNSSSDPKCNVNNYVMGERETTQEEGWVVCRVFKKKNHFQIKSSTTTSNNSVAAISNHKHGGTLEQMLQFMGNCPLQQPFRKSNVDVDDDDDDDDEHFFEEINEDHDEEINQQFLKLPSLETESTNNSSSTCRNNIQINYQPINQVELINGGSTADHHHHHSWNFGTNYESSPRIQDWASLDRLVASHLNYQTTDDHKTIPKQQYLYSDHDSISSRQNILTNEINHGDYVQPAAYNSSSIPPNYQTTANQDYQDLWNL